MKTKRRARTKKVALRPEAKPDLRQLAKRFVSELHGPSERLRAQRREQLRRTAVGAVIGRRQALDALARLRSVGLVAEDLAEIGRLEKCGEWAGLWILVGRRQSELEANEREARLAGDDVVRPRARTPLLMAEVVRLEGLLAAEKRRNTQRDPLHLRRLKLECQCSQLEKRLASHEERSNEQRREIALLVRENRTLASALAARGPSLLDRLKRWRG